MTIACTLMFSQTTPNSCQYNLASLYCAFHTFCELLFKEVKSLALLRAVVQDDCGTSHCRAQCERRFRRY